MKYNFDKYLNIVGALQLKMVVELRFFDPIKPKDFDEFKGEKSQEVYLLLPKHPNYELKIISGKKFEFRLRNSKDKSGFERWTKEISTDLKNSFSKDSIIEIITILSETRMSETWMELQKYTELSEHLKELLETKSLNFCHVNQTKIVDKEYEESKIEISFSKDYKEGDQKAYYSCDMLNGSFKKIEEKIKKNKWENRKPLGLNDLLLSKLHSNEFEKVLDKIDQLEFKIEK